MSGDTAIGPEDLAPQKGDAADQTVTEGVDAQEENERDMQRGVAGAEAKPLATSRGGEVKSHQNRTTDLERNRQ